MTYMNDCSSYMNAYYRELIGWKIVQAECVDCDGDEILWPVLILKNDEGKWMRVEVSCDPEGNGPGHLFIYHVEEGE